jgi:hypothetical protein
VPVEIDFRIVSSADGRVVPYLFHKTYQFGAQNPQEAEDQALRDGIQEGTLAALQSAGVIDSFTDPQTRRIGYRVNALPTTTLVAAADVGAAARGLAAPAGSYEVSGRLAADKIIVAGQRWIDRPRGAGMVGLNGSLSGVSISGKVTGGGCTQFELKRPN